MRGLLILAALALSACGGSSSSGSNNSGDQNQTPPDPLLGTFIDSEVANIRYQSGSFSGLTDELGRFQYAEGETVTFSIGDVQLPPVAAGVVVHVSDLFGGDLSDTRVINLARLLLTVDSDQNPDNGIQLAATAHSAASGLSLDFSSQDFETDVNDYLSSAGGGTSLVSSNDASTHIAQSHAEAEEIEEACENECELFVLTHEFLDGHAPEHGSSGASISASIQLNLGDDFTWQADTMNIEVFEISDDSLGDCWIEYEGLTCSESGFDFFEAFDNQRFRVIHGSLSGVENRVASFVLNQQLALNKTHVVHIYSDTFPAEGDQNHFKTWWRFVTEGGD